MKKMGLTGVPRFSFCLRLLKWLSVGLLPSEKLYSRAQCDGGKGKLTPTGPPRENADVAAAFPRPGSPLWRLLMNNRWRRAGQWRGCVPISSTLSYRLIGLITLIAALTPKPFEACRINNLRIGLSLLLQECVPGALPQNSPIFPAYSATQGFSPRTCTALI